MPDRDLVRKTKIEILKAVLELDPKAPVIGELAESLFEDGRYEEAVQASREGIAFHPDMLVCRVILAESLEALGQTEEAATAVESAQQKAGQVNQSLARLARLEAKLKGAAPAEPPAEDEAAPVDLPSATLAELYLRQGDKASAIRVFRQLLVRDPDNPSLKEKLQALTGGQEAPGDAGGKKQLLNILERWLAASRARAAIQSPA